MTDTIYNRNNSLKLHELLAGLTDAIRAHTPENAAAAGDETRRQIKLTEEQQAAYNAALDTMAEAEEHKLSMATREKKLAAATADLATARAQLQNQINGTDKFVADVNKRDTELKAQAALQTALQAKLTEQARTLDARASELSDEQRRLATWESVLIRKQKLLEGALKEVGV